MQLIGSLTSPFVRKVRVVLAEKKLEYDFALENVWSDSSTVTNSNPLGQVPCLIMDGGEAIFDSRVIVEYLDTLSPVGKLIPANGRERAAVKTWEALADGVADALGAARMEKHWPDRPPEQQCEAWYQRKLGKVSTGLAALSAALGDKPFCHGIAITLADIALICMLDYMDFRFPELGQWREDYPNLAGLHERLSVRPSLAETLPPAA